jgi:anti-anti-sigma factor
MTNCDVDLGVIQPEGILSAGIARQMLQQFAEYRQANITVILIDLQAVTMIDSFGLGTLMSMHTRLRMAGGELYLCGLQKQPRYLFDISALDRVFDIYPDQQAFETTWRETHQALSLATPVLHRQSGS